jgi:predicted MFS family arabinose efflux permease
MSSVSTLRAEPLAARVAVAMFLAFAFAYFFSALLRAVTATLAPAFSAELGLSSGDLGLLAGAYFLGFSVMQLPLGRWLDRIGPRRVLLGFLCVAVMACAAFAQAGSFVGLWAARALIGVGVSACLMAPMTAYRRHLDPTAQLRANSWMLMTGSLGMLASTLPVQWLMPLLGWRGLFWVVAAMLVLAMLLIAAWVPRDSPAAAAAPEAPPASYGSIFLHPYFVRLAPLAFVLYGGLLAVQSLWAGPWLTQVAGHSAGEAAQGLFAINLAMLCAFFAWGVLMPRLRHRGWTVDRLIALGVPLPLALLALAVVLGPEAQAPWWALWCVSCTVVSLSQPAVGQAFPTAVAGRALSAYNLVIFLGVFCVQWGIGLVIDLLATLGWERPLAMRAAFGLLCVAATASYGWFLLRRGNG